MLHGLPLPFLCSFLWPNSLQELILFSFGPRSGSHPYYITETTPEQVVKDAQDVHVTKSGVHSQDFLGSVSLADVSS